MVFSVPSAARRKRIQRRLHRSPLMPLLADPATSRAWWSPRACIDLAELDRIFLLRRKPVHPDDHLLLRLHGLLVRITGAGDFALRKAGSIAGIMPPISSICRM